MPIGRTLIIFVVWLVLLEPLIDDCLLGRREVVVVPFAGVAHQDKLVSFDIGMTAICLVFILSLFLVAIECVHDCARLRLSLEDVLTILLNCLVNLDLIRLLIIAFVGIFLCFLDIVALFPLDVDDLRL